MLAPIPMHPQPRPPAPRGPDGPFFDVVSELSPSHMMMVVRDAQSGAERTFTNNREDDDDPRGTLMSKALSWMRDRSGGAPFTARVHTPELRHVMTERDPGDDVRVADASLLVASTAWAQGTRVRIRRGLRQVEGPLRAPILYAASDGSTHPSGGMAAYSWVTSEGDFRTKGFEGDIFTAEVRAIASFAAWFARHRGKYGPKPKAVLFSDSLNAVRSFRDVTSRPLVRMSSTTRRRRNIELAYDLQSRGQLEVVWVRGHQGQPLNETADRLALMHYRSDRAGLPREHVDSLGSQIVEDALPMLQSTDWNAWKVRAERDWAFHTEEQRAALEDRAAA